MSKQGKKNLKARIRKSAKHCLDYGAKALAEAIDPRKNHEEHKRLAKKRNFNKLMS